MNQLRYCSHGGRLVGDFLDVPSDPTRYDHPASPSVGCSRLVCEGCGARVRNLPGVGGIEPLQGRTAELYAAKDWSELEWLEPIAARLYACRCRVWLENASRLLEEPDPEPDDPEFPWGCAGHPLPELPATIHGIRVDSALDFKALVESAFRGDLPEAVQEVPDFRTFPASWICSLWLQLAGLSASDRLARAVEDCLSSESPWLRGSALYFLRRLPRAAGLGEVLALAREPGSLTTEWPARYGTGEELATPLEVLLERLDVIPPGVELDPVEEQAALFLREQVVSGPAGGHPGLLSTVADYFGEWLATHIEEIAEQWPGRWKRVLDALVRSEQEEFAAIAGVAIVSGDRVPIADLQAWLAEPWNQYGAHGMVIQSALRGRRG